MKKTYDSSKKISRCVTGGAILLFGYMAAVMHLWRMNGIVYFFWLIMKKPVYIIDVNWAVLLLVNVFTYMHYMLIRLWTKNRINHIGIFLCQFIIVNGLIGVLVFMSGRVHGEMQQSAMGHIFMQSMIVASILYKDITQIDADYFRDCGLIRHIIWQIRVDRVVGLVLGFAAEVWCLGLFGVSFMQGIGCAFDGLLAYILLAAIIHAYVYNINHFTRDVEILSEKNGYFSLENYIVLRNYEETSNDKGCGLHNSEIIMGYILDLLEETSKMVAAVTKQQRTREIVISQKSTKKLPQILLFEGRKNLSILKDDISANISHKIYFYLYSRTIYNRALVSVNGSREIVKKLARVIWRMEVSQRKKLLAAIDSVQSEIKGIVAFNTEELSNALSIWSFQLTT
ncbi:hypothetical protein NEAUS03_1565 [Nematocida ausubeli]|nr:hypothetical protein NEAUS03_1565 [Nematocida ausubeli]